MRTAEREGKPTPTENTHRRRPGKAADPPPRGIDQEGRQTQHQGEPPKPRRRTQGLEGYPTTGGTPKTRIAHTKCRKNQKEA